MEKTKLDNVFPVQKSIFIIQMTLKILTELLYFKRKPMTRTKRQMTMTVVIFLVKIKKLTNLL